MNKTIIGAAFLTAAGLTAATAADAVFAQELDSASQESAAVDLLDTSLTTDEQVEADSSLTQEKQETAAPAEVQTPAPVTNEAQTDTTNQLVNSQETEKEPEVFTADAETETVVEKELPEVMDMPETTDSELISPQEDLKTLPNGWNTDKTQYYVDGVLLTNQKMEIDGKYYYFDASGSLLKGQQNINGGWYCFDLNDGSMFIGEKYLNTSYEKDGAKWVFYGADGIMRYGEVDTNGLGLIKFYAFGSGARLSNQMITIASSPSNGNKKTTYWANEKGEKYYGEKQVNGQWKYFDRTTGAMAVSTFVDLSKEADKTNADKRVYYNSQGNMLYGQQKIKINGVDRWFCFDKSSGAMFTGETQLSKAYEAAGAKTVYYAAAGDVASDSSLVLGQMLYGTNGWLKAANGQTYYIPDDSGAMAKGQKKIGNAWYCFNLTTGRMLTGERYLNQSYEKDGAKTVYYATAQDVLNGVAAKEGQMVYGEVKVNGAWKYFAPGTGARVQNKQVTITNSISNGGKTSTYYYDANGLKKTGEMQISGKWVFFDPAANGAMAKSAFIRLDSTNSEMTTPKTVYYNSKGEMLYGQQKINGNWYCFELSSGAMFTGLTTLSTKYEPDGAKTVLYASDGKMLYGAQKVNGKDYFFHTSSGARQTSNLCKVEGSYLENGYYYYGSDGVMLKNQYITLSASNSAGLGAGQRLLLASGKMATGLVETSKGTAFYNNKGLYDNYLVKNEDGTYYFLKANSDTSQTKATNCILKLSADAAAYGGYKSSTYYYVDAAGKLVTGRVVKDGKHYAFGSDGAGLSGLLTVDAVSGENAVSGKVTGYFDGGLAQFGYVKVGSDAYIFQESTSGWMVKNAEAKDGSDTFRAGADGKLITGWYNYYYYVKNQSGLRDGTKAVNMVVSILAEYLTGDDAKKATTNGTIAADVKTAVANGTSVVRYFNKNGKLEGGVRQLNGINYGFNAADGTPLNGLHNNIYYQNGQGLTGTVNGTVYKNGIAQLPSWCYYSGNTLVFDPPGYPTLYATAGSNFAKILCTAASVWGKITFTSGGRKAPNLDCIGYVMWNLNNSLGLNLTANSAHDFAYKGYTYEVSRSQLVPGDIVLFRGTWTYDLNHYSHSSIYMGNGLVMYVTYTGLTIGSMDAIQAKVGGRAPQSYRKLY